MKPIVTPETDSTFILEGFRPLPAAKCHDEEGACYVQSCWEMTAEERATIAKTGRVYVVTKGETVPAMLLAVQSQIQKGES